MRGSKAKDLCRKKTEQMPPHNIIVNRTCDSFPRVLLSEPSGSSAEVLLCGAQVVSWKNERGEELLFTRSKGTGKSSSKVINGGITLSVCFQQFGNSETSEQHGFAINRIWSLDICSSPPSPVDNRSSVDLVLKSTEEDLKKRLQGFELRLRISLSPGKLTVIPQVKNIDNRTLTFRVSLRNHLSVSEISEVRIEGLETLDYFDNLLQRRRFTEQADAVTFDGEVDRIYLGAPKNIAIIDHGKKRTFVLSKARLPDVVLWNPWEKLAKALPHFGSEDYKAMLSVDSAAIEHSIILKSFQEWSGCQELSIVSSSYCSGQLDPRKVLQGFS